MEEKKLQGKDRRQYIRLNYRRPFDYKVCREDTVSSLLSGYARNISQAGLLCNLDKEVPRDSTLWLRLDLATLHICQEIEKRSVILQNGVLGRVAWSKHQKDGSYEIGVRFLTKEEKGHQEIEKWIKKD